MRAPRALPPDFTRRLAELELEWRRHSTAERAELLSELARFPFSDTSGRPFPVSAKLLELALARLLNLETRRILLELCEADE
jgi:hypothetical protein